MSGLSKFHSERFGDDSEFRSTLIIISLKNSTGNIRTFL